MVLLQKEILPAGRYRVSTPNGPKEKKFTAKSIRQISQVANRMVKSGLNIPAPFEHHPDAVPVTEVGSADSFNNGGHWKRFWISNKNGKPALWGEVEMAGKEEDAESPAFKALNTAKSTSVCVRDSFTDGKGRDWENALLHVALVSHPVVPDQKDFEKVPTESSVVNMSMNVDASNYDPAGDQSKVLDLIQELKKVGIYIPENTNKDTLCYNLLIATKQYNASPDSNQPIEPVPVYMSTDTNTEPTKEDNMSLKDSQLQALLKAEVENPETGKPFTVEELNPPTEKDPKATGLLKAFASRLKKTTEQGVTSRISNLVKSGRITQEIADSVLLPKVGFEMSLENGEIADHPLEITLSTMEALPASEGAKEPPDPMRGVTEHQPPLSSSSEEVSEELQNASIEEMLQYIN